MITQKQLDRSRRKGFFCIKISKLLLSDMGFIWIINQELIKNDAMSAVFTKLSNVL